MKKISNQSGLAIVEMILVIVIAGLIGFVGYKVYDTQTSTDETLKQAESTSNAPLSSEATTTPIKSTADLDKAEKELEAVNPDDSNDEAAELDSQMAAF